MSGPPGRPMTELVRKENVYYLPAQPVEQILEPPRVTLRARLSRAWWRFRLTVIEIRAAIRRVDAIDALDAGRRAGLIV